MTCQHKNLGVLKHLTQCSDCKEYFAVKVVNIVAASNNGSTGHKYMIIPSNNLGWYCDPDNAFYR